jgi:hypothetical protein
MIGRHDILFVSEAASEIMEGAIRLVCASWRDVIIEDAESGDLVSLQSLGVAELPAELLIYKNSDARVSWSTNGAIPENANTMIHVLRGDGSMTVVVDDPNAAEMSKLLGAIRDHVFQDIFWIKADAA